MPEPLDSLPSPPPAPQRPGQPQPLGQWFDPGGLHRQRLAIAIAAGFGMAATFLPWVHVPILGTVYGTAGDGWITILLFVPAMVLAFRGSKRLPVVGGARLGAAIPAAVAVLVGVEKIVNLAQVASAPRGNALVDSLARLVQAGVGLYVLIGAGAALVLVAWLMAGDVRLATATTETLNPDAVRAKEEAEDSAREQTAAAVGKVAHRVGLSAHSVWRLVRDIASGKLPPIARTALRTILLYGGIILVGVLLGFRASAVALAVVACLLVRMSVRHRPGRYKWAMWGGAATATLLLLFAGHRRQSPGELSAVWPGYLGDETPLVQLEANPDAFLGKPITACGIVSLTTYYNFTYTDAASTHYSFRFREWGKTPRELTGNEATLYLRRDIGHSIVDRLVKCEESYGAGTPIGMRVKVALARYRGRQDLANYWNFLELVDVQYADPASGYTRWGPWVLTPDKPDVTGVQDENAASPASEVSSSTTKLAQDPARQSAVERPAAPDTPSKPPVGWVKIVNRGTGLALHGPPSNERPPRVERTFRIERAGDDYEIRCQEPGKCVALADWASKEEYASKPPHGRHQWFLSTAPDSGSPLTRWGITPLADGFWSISSRATGKCLEFRMKESKETVQWQSPFRAGDPMQEWRFDTVK